ncbi:MAG TPA: hypothetical protein VK338_04580 [Candidatus Nitrosocosmicus sp.]|nr:hypothetical protein [Candidatus Nitrosocosmicus sp.]
MISQKLMTGEVIMSSSESSRVLGYMLSNSHRIYLKDPTERYVGFNLMFRKEGENIGGVRHSRTDQETGLLYVEITSDEVHQLQTEEIELVFEFQLASQPVTPYFPGW